MKPCEQSNLHLPASGGWVARLEWYE